MKPGFVRIIAGKWRGRRLKVAEVDGLRPTPDRVRETLFNWLAMRLPQAVCLDMFTGTGALGLEALSRGAAHVTMVDQSREVVTLLKTTLAALGAENADVYMAKVPEGLHPVAKVFDVVFLDPPYQANLLLPCCHYLETHGYLANLAHIYLEADHLIEDNDLPPTRRILKTQKAGQVYFHLAQRDASTYEQ